jgi:hypothetical protein
MICPKCSAEMENGFVQAGGARIFWTPKKHKILSVPRSDGNDIVLAESYISLPSMEAYCCKTCNFILMPISS